MIEYRPFHNTDPPKLTALWNQSRLGRGAAQLLSNDILETLVFAQPYFDRNGLILACDGPRVVGCVHAGFGVNRQQTALDYTAGVICAVFVHPEYRRRGIGRTLIARAEKYLQEAGAESIEAGPAPPRDPFYVGMYGGAACAGFLESDAEARPFFEGIGYQPSRQYRIYQCDLNQHSAPVSLRLMSIRRKMEIVAFPQPQQMTWWWVTRFGHLESLCFQLAPKAGGPSVARLTVVGLDLYVPKWQVRAVGIPEIRVPEEERRNGYAQALVVGTCRRLKEEMVTHVECHSPAENEGCLKLLESCGFSQVDTGIVYRRAGGEQHPAAAQQ